MSPRLIGLCGFNDSTELLYRAVAYLKEHQ